MKVFNFLLKLFLFLSPIFLYKDFLPSFAKGLFFIVGSLTLFIATLSVKPIRDFKNIWLMLFLAFFLFRCFWGGETDPGEWFNFWQSMAGFFYVLCGVILFKTVYCYAENIKQFFKPILLVCLLNLFLACFQVAGHDLVWEHTSKFNPICGIFELPQQLSQYSSMVVPTLYYLHPALIVFPILCLILTKELSAGVALLLGLCFFLWNTNKRRMLILVVVSVILFSLLNFHYIQRKWYTRPVMWERTIRAAIQKPFLGWGYKSFDDAVNGGRTKLGVIQNPNAFSDYLHTAQEFGFPILIIVFLFFRDLFKKFYATKVKSFITICLGTSVFIVLMNMAGQIFIRHGSVAGTFIVLLAFFFIKVENDLKKEK